MDSMQKFLIDMSLDCLVLSFKNKHRTTEEEENFKSLVNELKNGNLLCDRDTIMRLYNALPCIIKNDLCLERLEDIIQFLHGERSEKLRRTIALESLIIYCNSKLPKMEEIKLQVENAKRDNQDLEQDPTINDPIYIICLLVANTKDNKLFKCLLKILKHIHSKTMEQHIICSLLNNASIEEDLDDKIIKIIVDLLVDIKMATNGIVVSATKITKGENDIFKLFPENDKVALFFKGLIDLTCPEIKKEHCGKCSESSETADMQQVIDGEIEMLKNIELRKEKVQKQEQQTKIFNHEEHPEYCEWEKFNTKKEPVIPKDEKMHSKRIQDILLKYSKK